MLKMKFIIVVFVMLTSLSGCAKDYDLNPYTTLLNQIVKHNVQNKNY